MATVFCCAVFALTGISGSQAESVDSERVEQQGALGAAPDENPVQHSTSARQQIERSFDEALPMNTREASLRLFDSSLANRTIVHDIFVRDALIRHVDGEVPALRDIAFRALRPYELDRAWLEKQLDHRSVAVQREAWLQMDRRYGKRMPLQKRWALTPGAMRSDMGTLLFLTSLVTIAVGGICSVLLPVLAISRGKSRGASAGKAIAAFFVTAVATCALAIVVFVAAIGSQHANAFSQTDFMRTLSGSLVAFWVGLFVMFRVMRSGANDAPDQSSIKGRT